MSNPRLISPSHRREQGQTIVLVALALVTLLAMAALAIDVVTLYVARSEMQRAADAAALAGAKAFVDSGVTTDPSNTNLQTLAQDMANATISSIVQQNKIAGAPPVLASPPAFSFTNAGNPTLSVTLQRTDLPTFFARIWGSRLATVTASATAEAYNPSNWQTSTGISVAPKCVKPLLIPNKDPGHAGSTFVSATTGTVTLPGIYPAGVIGETFGAPLSLSYRMLARVGIRTISVSTPIPPPALSYLRQSPSIRLKSYAHPVREARTSSRALSAAISAPPATLVEAPSQ